MKNRTLTRREALEKCIIGGLLVAGVPMSQTSLLAFWEKPTPPNVLGPFFKKGAPNAAQLRAPGDPGFPLGVSGKVMNTRGDVVPDARIEIWQANHQGLYDVQGYRYRARLAPDASAGYQFETVMPGHYPDRVAQHIHYIVSAPGHKPLVTQLYFATDPVFEGDPDKNFGKDPLVKSRELVRPVTLFEQPAASPHAAVVFELCLERA